MPEFTFNVLTTFKMLLIFNSVIRNFLLILSNRCILVQLFSWIFGRYLVFGVVIQELWRSNLTLLWIGLTPSKSVQISCIKNIKSRSIKRFTICDNDYSGSRRYSGLFDMVCYITVFGGNWFIRLELKDRWSSRTIANIDSSPITNLIKPCRINRSTWIIIKTKAIMNYSWQEH